MTFLPIVERELRVAARVTATYRNRVLSAAAVAVVAVVLLLVGAFSASLSQIGAVMFLTLSWLALLFCVLEGARKTADCISVERREGTLGLLLLTDLKGHDITLGKLAATSLGSVYGLLSILPILALSLLLGGVTQGEFWRMALALFSVLFFSLCAGLWVSAHSRVERRAAAMTLWVIAGMLAVPLTFGATGPRCLSPGFAFFSATEAVYQLHPAGYWQSLCAALLMSCLLLIWASLAVTRVRLDKEIPSVGALKSGRRPDDVARSVKARTQLLDLNPALWLAARGFGHRLAFWLLIGIAVAGSAVIWSRDRMASLPVMLFLFFFVNLAALMRFARMACHCLAEARANDALEMLLATPLTVREIIAGQRLALKRAVLAPMLILFTTESAILISTEVLNGLWPAPWSGHYGFNSSHLANILGFGLLALALYVFEILALMWAGMWFGLSAQNEGQAFSKTLCYVLLLPCLCGVFPWLGFLVALAVLAFTVAMAEQKLNSEFRSLAARRSQPPAADGWFSWFRKSAGNSAGNIGDGRGTPPFSA